MLTFTVATSRLPLSWQCLPKTEFTGLVDLTCHHVLFLHGHRAGFRIINTLLPCLNWSILPECITIFTILSVIYTSQAYSWMASSKQGKPAKAKRKNIVICRLSRVGLASVSFTITAKISVGIGLLFWTGLTQILFTCWKVSCTIHVGLDVGDGRPAKYFKARCIVGTVTTCI